MAKNAGFIMDGESFNFENPNFYSFEIFDHDLLLFCDTTRGLRLDYDNLKIIGGRSAGTLSSNNLCEVLSLSDNDKHFMSDFLFDTSRKCAFAVSDNRPVMIFNQLFRSTGLGVAIIFDRGLDEMLGAMKGGDLANFGERIYSPTLVALARDAWDKKINCSELDYSISKLHCAFSSMLLKESGKTDAIRCIKAAASLIGGEAHIETVGNSACISLDTYSASSLLLCVLSICRRLSLERDAKILLDFEMEHAKFGISFDCINEKLSDIEIGALGFCDRLATRLEMPFSAELLSGRFNFEFVPFRVDPSLYGLKAGVNIKFNCEY